MHPSLLLLVCANLMSTWAAPAFAGVAQVSFAVQINMQTSNSLPDTGLCRSGTSIGIFGAAVTVICSTGATQNITGDASALPWATMPGNSYRFLTQVSRAGESLATVDIYAGSGAVTSWRIISLANQDYLEMMVHW